MHEEGDNAHGNIYNSDLDGTQFIRSLFFLVLDLFKKYSTSLYSLFNIVGKVQKIQYFNQRHDAKIQYIRTKFEPARKKSTVLNSFREYYSWNISRTRENLEQIQ